MFFYLTKILGLLAMPSTLAVLATAAGLWLAGRDGAARAGRRLIAAGLAALLVAGFLPLGNALLWPLEERFSAQKDADLQGPYAGIILLGGFEDGWVSSGRGQLTVNESAERLIEGLRLARLRPEAKVIFSGGVAQVWQPGAGALEPLRRTLLESGIGADRIVLEGASRNTAENAAFTKAMLNPEPGARYLLVTSAYHMPRAMGLFRKAGFDVEAYPVDYRLKDAGDLLRLFDRIPAGLQRTDLAAGEWLGLFAYWTTGRIDSLWPAP